MSTEKTTQSVDSLQATINKKADLRLKEDLFKLSIMVNGSRLISGMKNNDETPKLFTRKPDAKSLLAIVDGETSNKRVYLQDDFSSDPIENMFGVTKDQCSTEPRIYGAFSKQLYDHWLPIYINEETKMFVDQINKLQEDVDTLSGSVANLEYNQH